MPGCVPNHSEMLSAACNSVCMQPVGWTNQGRVHASRDHPFRRMSHVLGNCFIVFTRVVGGSFVDSMQSGNGPCHVPLTFITVYKVGCL
jgi:hypothetical protein